tara:strand:+ start:10490 stop:11242 length:753 start_codon:yes stop_codon:yes gene_type:complete
MPCSDDDKLVYNIKELPEVFNVEPVDLFIVETLAGTSIVAFENINIDISQTTFEAPFEQHTTDIQELSTKLGLVEDLVLQDDNNEPVSVDTIVSSVVSAIYPVGSIYITLNNSNPQTILGVGGWTKVSKGRFLVGQGTGSDGTDSLNVSNTGNDSGVGKYNHTLTVNQMPNHKHSIKLSHEPAASGAVNDEYGYPQVDATGPFAVHNDIQPDGSSSSVNGVGNPLYSTGGNQSHNNIPPFFGAYIWQRTS